MFLCNSVVLSSSSTTSIKKGLVFEFILPDFYCKIYDFEELLKSGHTKKILTAILIVSFPALHQTHINNK